MNHMESPSRVTRWAAGVLVALMTMLGVGVYSTNTAPEAEAQGVELAIATELAGKAKDVVCGEESDIGKCAKKFTEKVKDLKGDMEDFKKCMEDGDITKIGDCIEEAMSDLEEEEEEEEPQPENPVKEEYTLYRLSSALTTLYGNYWVDFEGNKAKDESKDKDKDKDSEDSEGGSDSEDSEDSGASADDKSDEELTEMVDFAEMWSPVLRTPANAGAFLGYEDKNFNDDTAQAFNGSNASNDRVYTHELARSLSSVPVGESHDIGANNGVRDYLYFGSALNGLGLDSPAGAGGNQAADGTAQRFMLGNAMLLAFMGSGLIDVVFATVVRALQIINPFNLLFDAVRGADDYFGGTKSMFTAGVDGVGDDSVFSGIRDFFATVYQGTLTIGWMVTVPITIGIVAMGMLLFRRYERGKNLKHLFIRITYLTLGIPLLGVTYTSALNSMEGASGRSGTVHAQGVVLSTYVDFEKWAMDYRLAIPNDVPSKAVSWFEGNGQPMSESQVKVRKTALAINQMINDNWQSGKGQSFDNESGDYTYMTDNMDYGAVPGEGKLSKGTSMNTSDDAGFGNTINLLNRYKDNAGVSGATLDNSVTSYLAAEDRKQKNKEEGTEDTNKNSNPGDGNSNAVASPIEWISEWNTAEKINSQGQKSAGEDDESAGDTLKTVQFNETSTPNPLMYVRSGLHASGEGNYAGEHDEDVTNSDGANHAVSFFSTTNNKCTARDITGQNGSIIGEGSSLDPNGSPADCNMSLLSLYNYLNTRFDDKEGTIDGSGMSSSVNSRAMHSSVSAVGSGAMKLIYWFSSMTLLVSFIVIGFGYALALLFNSIKRAISLISAVPFAAMGFMGGIAKVIVYAIALFLELLGTLFIYRLVQEFLMVIPSLIEAPMSEFLDGGNGDLAAWGIAETVAGFAAKNQMAIGILVTLIASAGVLIFTILAMKLRSTLIGAIDEAVTRFINKLMDTNVSGGTEAGKQSQAKSMLARGAGMAVGHRMMTGGSDDSADGADGDGGTGLAGDDDPTGGGGGGMRNAAMAGAAGLSNLSGSVDDAGDAEGIYGADGGDGAVNATDESGFYNPDGSEGLAADGDYSVQNGLLTDSDGQIVSDQEGNPVTPGDIANHDAAGNLYGDDGQLATDKNGVPMTLADVGGVDENGNLLDHNGNQLTDGDGNTISANSMATQGGVQLPTDANGDLMDAQGATVRGEDGNAIPISSIGGFDAEGNALDTQGNQIMDAKGEPVTAESMGLSAAEQSAVAGSGSGAESFGGADSTRADGLSTLSDAELANNAAENGALASGSPELVGASAAAGVAGTALAGDGSADMSAGIAGTDGVGETSMVDGDGAVADTVGGGETGGSFEANPASYSGSGLAGGSDVSGSSLAGGAEFTEDSPKSLGSLASSAADSIQSGDASVSDIAGDAISGYGENAQAAMGEQMGKFNESMNDAADRAINSDTNDGSALGAARSLAQMGTAAHESFNESGLKSAAAAAGLGGAGIAGAAAAKHGLSQAGNAGAGANAGAGEAGLSGHTGQPGQAGQMSQAGQTSRGPVGGAMPAGSAPVGGRGISGNDAGSGHGGTFQSQTGQGAPNPQTGSVSPASESRDSGNGSSSMNKIFAAQAASSMVSGALGGNQGRRNNTASQATTGGHGSGGKGGAQGGNGSSASQFINSTMRGMQRGTMYGSAAAAGAAGARGRGDHDNDRRRHRDRDRDRDRFSKRRGRDEDEDDIFNRSSRRGGEDDGSGRLRGHFQGGSQSGPLGGNSDGPGTLGV